MNIEVYVKDNVIYISQYRTTISVQSEQANDLIRDLYDALDKLEDI